jgi:hemin uptake protein HemP
MATTPPTSSAPQAAALPGTGESLHPAAGTVEPTPRLRVPSTDILCGSAEVEIDHRGMLYRLRVTSLGKLILTK